jgi:glycine/D-amino acid oxidase-like deaminating enzyme
MRRTADAVIIGGGVTGASIAFHLARRRAGAVVLVEKAFLAAGPTGRSSACLRQHYSTPETCRMVLRSLRFFERFAEHTGGRTASFVRTGYLLGVDDRLRAPMETSVALQRSQSIDTRLITPEEARAIEPRLCIDDLTAACYEPDAGHADPSQATQGLAAAARDLGVEVVEQTAVTGLRAEGDRVRAVETTRGVIETPVVVNAAGAWGDRVARMAGVEIPLTVCRHRINLVEWPPEARGPHPMVYDFVTNIYTRPETGGLILVGSLDDERNDRADPDAYREGVTYDETADALGRLVTRFPALERGRVARGYAGCFDVTPDWHPVLDQVGPAGFHVAVGFSGHGFKLSPAVGEMVARLVTEGKTPADDVHAFRLSRFGEGKAIRGTYGDWLMC